MILWQLIKTVCRNNLITFTINVLSNFKLATGIDFQQWLCSRATIDTFVTSINQAICSKCVMNYAFNDFDDVHEFAECVCVRMKKVINGKMWVTYLYHLISVLLLYQIPNYALFRMHSLDFDIGVMNFCVMLCRQQWQFQWNWTSLN